LVGGLGGTSGIIGSYFIISSRQKMLDLKKDTETLESRVEDLQKKVKDAENRIRYVFELRDRNYEVRIRAVQQLGASNDIAAVSMLIESLERDRSINVRMEAAYWLGRLLSDGGESEALREGLRALTTAAKHRNPGVRQVAIEALDTLVCNNVQLTRRTVQQLRAIARLDGSATVIEAAQTALEHIKQQREGTLGSQQGEQQS
jgi:HEAT repeat protein